jgi:uncharacterized protein YkwD
MSGLALFRRSQWFVAAALVAGTLASGAQAADTVPGRASDSQIRGRMLDLVNAARSRSRTCGTERYAATDPLTSSRKLNEAAASHARDMARKKYFDHRGADGSQPGDRVRRAGYQPRISGENIAFGPESVEEVVEGWLASPGHCANIMEPRFKHLGVGVATGARRGRIYWVQTFGAPLPGHRP